MNAFLQHLIVLPIIVPLMCAAAMLFIPESGRRARVTLALSSALVQLAIAVAIEDVGGGGFGGTVAAPIAADVIFEALRLGLLGERGPAPRRG